MAFNTAAQWHQEAGEKLDVSLSSAKPQLRSRAFSEHGLTEAYSRRTNGWPVRANRHPFCAPGSCKRTALAVMASVAAIVVLISICRFDRRKKENPLSATRKLSEDKAASSGRPQVCGETQEEAETASPVEESPAATSPGGAEPPTKKAKTSEGEGEGGEGTAGPSGTSPPSQGKRKAKKKHLEAEPPQPAQPPPHSPGDESDEAGEDLPGALAPPMPSEQQQQTATSEEGPSLFPPPAMVTAGLGERSWDEEVAVQAMLLLHQKPFISGSPSEETAQQREEEPQPSTSTGGVPGPHPLPGPTQEEQPQPVGTAEAAAGLVGLPFVPRTFPSNHSFFRLPTLQPGVNPMRVDMQRALSSGSTTARPLPAMRLARGLLARDSLSQNEADTLCRLVELLMAHCHQHQRAPLNPRDVRRTAELLGTRFLLFDIIVSGLKVTRQDFAASGWQALVNLVPHDMSGCPQGHAVFRKSHYGAVARALSSALATLKGGERPPKEVLYGLKYALFCAGDRRLRFRGGGYDPWKLDCPNKR